MIALPETNAPVIKAGRSGIRLFILLSVMGLAACASPGPRSTVAGYAAEPASANARFVDPRIATMYGAVEDGGWHIPAVDPQRMDAKNIRQVVDYRSSEPTGTIVVDPYSRFLYLIMENGKAMRYGVGVGKAGLEFTGEGIVRRKAEWPRWTPTSGMIAREPEKYGGELRSGMEGGIDNPLGARALYLFQGGRDTLYRIHGTNEEWSIGKAVSSGCIRMLNQDVIDLNRRVPDDTRVVVLGSDGRPQQNSSLASINGDN